MASTTLTYGKKKGLLRSLGSRRRQKHIKESLQADNASAAPAPTQEPTIRLIQSEPLTIPASPYDNTSPRRQRVHDGYRTSSIEDMASCLLDDSDTSSEDRGLARSSYDEIIHAAALEAASPRRATPETVGNLLLSPLALSPLIEKSLPTTDARRSSRIGKYSPKSPGRGSKRATASRSRSDSAQKRKESGLKRPLPQSKTLSLDPFKFHPTGLKASPSVPLSVRDGNVGKGSPVIPKADILSAVADADEINQKVHAMLAATTALKPSPAPMESQSTSKLGRMVSTKVLSKVSNAWDRLHSKAPAPDTKRTKYVTPIAQDEQDGLLDLESPMRSPSPSNMSPISTIEIRLNEGDNLNKKKVQKIVGGQVVRKPVADDGKSLRNGKSIDDPFSELRSVRTPTHFESRLKREVDYEVEAVPPLPSNPFESEKGFDNDIEDRILSTTPVGSSTPRIRAERVSVSSSDRSPTTKRSRSTRIAVGRVLDGAARKLERDHVKDAQANLQTITPTSPRKALDPVRRLRHSSISISHNGDPTGLKRVKKHPSPSKEALEDLEVAFRKYAYLKVSGANQNELDELASSFISSPKSLTPRDKNRLISNRLSVSKIDSLSSPGNRKGLYRPLSSASSHRLERSIDNPVKLRAETRLAPPYRPHTAHADDVDELH